MQYSYSRVSLFHDCPYHFKLRYIDKLTELNEYKADNPLLIGSALHNGVETDKNKMLQDYFQQYPIVTDEVITESMKLEIIQMKVKEWLQQFIDDECELIHEYKIDTPEYIGFVDLIIKKPDGTCMVVDFKYSNNIKNYVGSGQLHIYKHFLEKQGFKVSNMGFLFCPKINIKIKKRNKTNKQDELIEHFRKRCVVELSKKELQYLPIIHDETKVVEFFETIKEIEASKEYPKNPNDTCFQCLTVSKKKANQFFPFSPPDYLQTIQNTNGEILMKLPSTERRNVEKVEKRVFWLYGAPFTGKTTFTNEFPNPLMLNTDGNIRFVDAPYISIANKVESTGRVTTRTLAWDIFKDTISELEKQDNDFKTIIVDLVEDTYEACRLYMYDKLGIEHESDDSFRAWDKVRTEFLSTFKRLVHLPYENIILLSHEDTSKDITKRGGDKTTAIKPNLSDKPALKIAGMVDIVARVVADDEDRRITFKSLDYVFGGGRLPNIPVTEIELDYEKLIAVYDDANAELKPKKESSKPRKKKEESAPDINEEGVAVDNNGEELAEQPKKRKPRKKKTVDKEEVTSEDTVSEVESETEEVKPVKRERKKRQVDTVVEDETPPGEEAETIEKTDDAEEAEKPKRRRRTRRTKE
ncbi:hypothetical protein FM106_18645 [Brachybacterium faecium]|nr:hypothetical protein FM106_18645 [Brachybacterium faecium]